MNPDGTVPTVVRLARRWFSTQPAEDGPIDVPPTMPVRAPSADRGFVTGAPTAPLGAPVASGAGRL